MRSDDRPGSRAAVLAAAVLATAGLLRSRRMPPRAAGAKVRGLADVVRPRAQKVFWRTVYGLSTRRAVGADDAFMNYGYAAVPSEQEAPAEDPGGGSYGTALYDRVVNGTELAGKAVLEVGCGRGGGSAHVFDAHRPGSMVAVDLTPAAIKRARQEHPRRDLSFAVADAEDLPFPDASFDVVLNVESCHCYPDVPRFLREVHRVLRPGGLLLLADVRHTSLDGALVSGPLKHEDIDDFRRQVAASPFTLREEEDITANVTHALVLDSPRRRALVEARFPKRLQPQALNFAGVAGSALHDAYVSGEMTYVRMVLVKDAGP